MKNTFAHVLALTAVTALSLSAQSAAPKPPAAPAPPKSASQPAPPKTDVVDIDVGKAMTQPPVEVAPDTVVLTMDGRKFTAGEVEQIVRAMPPQLQSNYARDKKEFLRQLGLIFHLAKLGEQDKLDEQSPYKERLAFARAQTLMQAKIDDYAVRIPILPEDQKKFYDENKDKYTQAKVKILYIAYSTSPQPAAGDGKKILTEAEAKTKADGLVKQIRGGADFVKLVKENSDDLTSKEKDGDFGEFKKSDSLPDAVKTAVFALQPGQVSDPVQQANGFYIFKVEQMTTRTYDEIKDEIFNELKTKRFQEWFDGVRKSVDVKFENEAYFGPSPIMAQPPAPAPAK
jgi:hypothetical protein